MCRALPEGPLGTLWRVGAETTRRLRIYGFTDLPPPSPPLPGHPGRVADVTVPLLLNICRSYSVAVGVPRRIRPFVLTLSASGRTDRAGRGTSVRPKSTRIAQELVELGGTPCSRQELRRRRWYNHRWTGGAILRSAQGIGLAALLERVDFLSFRSGCRVCPTTTAAQARLCSPLTVNRRAAGAEYCSVSKIPRLSLLAHARCQSYPDRQAR